ncbi:glycosyltransferase family 4 protein [Pirellulaceae bacterium SH501]
MQHAAPEVLVTNFHRRFTGVSATADAVLGGMHRYFTTRLVGRPLPSADQVLSLRSALALSRYPPPNRPFSIWHVRRNLEMAIVIFARDYLKLPIRIVFTSAAQRLHSRMPRELIARMDAVVATTSQAAAYVPHLAGIVPHGVDIDRFHPAQDRSGAWRKLGLPGERGIGIVGRIRPEKGTDCFVEAMCRVLNHRPGYTGVIVGRAMQADLLFEKQLRRRLEEAGLQDRVIFLGEQPRERLPEIVRSLSLLVASPRYEGYGMTPLEAMASGVPVVATNTGVYSQIIEDGRNGYVVAIEDVEGLSQAILNVTSDDARLSEMGKYARQIAASRLSIDKEVHGYAQVYERLWKGEVFV